MWREKNYNYIFSKYLAFGSVVIKAGCLTSGAGVQRDGRGEPQEPEVGETQGGGQQQWRRFLEWSVYLIHFWIIKI